MEGHNNTKKGRKDNPNQGRFNIRMEKRIIDDLRTIAATQDRSLNDLFKEMSASIIRFYTMDLREEYLSKVAENNPMRKAPNQAKDQPELESVLKLIEQKKKNEVLMNQKSQRLL